MDIPHHEMNYNSKGGHVDFGSDDKLIVQFMTKAVQNKLASMEAGRPVFENQTFVRVQQPGERDFLERPIQQTDRQRWPRHWAAFEAGNEQMPAGTPIAILFPNDGALVETLRYHKVMTVEQLADLNDTQKQNIGMGALEWTRRAIAFLESASGGKEFQAISDELKHAREENAGLRQQMAEMNAKIDAMAARSTTTTEPQAEEPVRRGPGRPPKNRSDD